MIADGKQRQGSGTDCVTMSGRENDPDATQCGKMKPGLNIIRKSNIFLKKLLMYLSMNTYACKYALKEGEFL